MNTKFISYEGFGKIQDLNPKKKNSVLKNIKKFFKICGVIFTEDILKSTTKERNTKKFSNYSNIVSKRFLQKKAVFSAFVAVILCVITATSPVLAAEEYSEVDNNIVTTEINQSLLADNELAKEA